MFSRVLNFNVGVLGHIDSGKTSLSKALSTVASTASFDRNPQSQERGITIDLGFSSFSVDVPEHLKIGKNAYEVLQFTLVDCPGHASLIRTIIGGAQIIDLIMLVVDITKGMQTQTAECLILGEITCNQMIVVLNKIDLLSLDKREQTIQKMKKKILKTLEKTKFRDSVVIPVSANPNSNENPIGMDLLVNALKKHTYLPERSESGPFMFAVDHCFAIKGQGTVMTGTVLQGCITISDSIEIPSEKIIRKVKSIQMFKKPITKAIQGDRVGICVTQFDSKILERGTVCSPGYMETVDTILVNVQKIPYFKGNCVTNSKFHVSIMHDTLMAKCSFFADLNYSTSDINMNGFNYDVDYVHLDEISETETSDSIKQPFIYALLQFDKPVIISRNSTFIASKLETDIHANVCRLAFHGKVLDVAPYKSESEILSRLKVYKEKSKEGFVDRMVNEHQVIVRDLFKKETNIKIFCNMKVVLSTGEVGIIEGSFGQSGKVNIHIPNGLSPETVSVLHVKKGKKEVVQKNAGPIKVILKFKKYVYDSKRKMSQTP